MTNRTQAVTRRRLIYAGAMLAPALTKIGRQAVAQQDGRLAGQALHILLPRHRLTTWEDAIHNAANSWSQQTGASVRIDVVPAADIPATFAAELAMGSGHDLIGTDLPLLHHADDLRDLSSLGATAEERFGSPASVCNQATILADGRQPAFSIAYGPAPLIYRRSIWETYGLPDGPTTWEQLHEIGAQIWNEQGMNLGFGLSSEPGSERFAHMLVTAHGGALQDADGKIALNSPETMEAAQFAVNLYRDAMSPESLDWQVDRQVDLLRDGIASVISDDITAIRVTQARNQDIANDLFLAPPPMGPASESFGTSLATTYRAFHVPSFSPNQEAAESFLLMLVESSQMLAGANQLAERPAYGSLVPSMVQAGGWLDNDPYGATPPEKFGMLKSSAAWTTSPAGPSPANGLATQAHEAFVLSRMLARAVRGERSPEETVADAEAELQGIEAELRRVPRQWG